MADRGAYSDTLIHPLSSLVTIVVDGLWSILEIGATISIAGLSVLIPIVIATGTTTLVAVCLVQRFVARDDWGASIAKGLVMGIFAGVPYPFTGTAVGAVFLGWAGVKKLLPRG